MRGFSCLVCIMCILCKLFQTYHIQTLELVLFGLYQIKAVGARQNNIYNLPLFLWPLTLKDPGGRPFTPPSFFSPSFQGHHILLTETYFAKESKQF